MPHTYAIHGLTIRSEFPLPELESSRDFQPQILIRHGRVSREGIEFDGGPRSYQAQPGLIRIAWDRVGAFELRNGQELIVDPESEVEPEVVRLFVLGAAMGLLLHQRGLPVLHASVVAHGPCCVGIVGAKGWGKSTLASALLVRGWSLVTDDLAVIDLKGPDPMVAPGVRVVKLWPQSLAALGGAPEDHPRIHSQVDKRFYAADRVSEHPVRLTHLCFLGLAETPAVEPVEPLNALLELLPHWYAARYGNEMIQALGADRNFLDCGALVHRTSSIRLNRPVDLSCLAELADLIGEALSLEQVGG